MQGAVKFCKIDKGWGVIISPAVVSDVWIHFSVIESPGGELAAGDVVDFDVEEPRAPWRRRRTERSERVVSRGSGTVRADTYGVLMDADTVQITPELPVAFGLKLVIRFFPEYSAQHPLWFDFGYPDLADLQLPEDLAGRLHRWSAYWDSTFHWDHGWPAGAPAPWWTEEEDQLPRDVAIAFGSDFIVEAGDLYLRSRTVAGSPATAAAMHALLDAEADQRARIRADIAAGVRYDVIAGDTSYTEWLAARKRDEPPVQ